MRFLPKKYFRWREPKTFLKLGDAFERSKLRWWYQPLWTLIAAAMLMSSWSIARLNPHKHPPDFSSALTLALVGGAFFAYVIPWIISLCPSEVHFYDSYLVRVRGNTHRQVKYSDIASFSWHVRDDFATLILTHRRHKREILVGVPNELSREAISQFLLDHNVQFNQSA